VIVLYGARRVGKTTLCKHLIENQEDAKYINCELLQYRSALETTNTELLSSFLGNSRLVVLDEAQNIHNIGSVLKVMVDTFPNIQVIATGSSAFELNQQLAEPLTGRSRYYMLYPFSIQEITQNSNLITTDAKLERILRFGMYPEVFDKPEQDAIEELYNISSNYLYKDILQFERLKRPDLVFNLLKALAFQIGNEISLNELSRLIGENVHTIQRYLDLLEKSYIITRLNSFSNNPRNEIAKGRKIYYNDLGIRNAIIQNFNPISLRNDTGALWENFCVIEKLKSNNNNRIFTNSYFRRTYQQKEIDYIEEMNGKLYAYEFKFAPQAKFKIPKDFLELYPESTYNVITRDNYLSFLLSGT
jgi:predicted AAA+ superfamily ATPase